jgi:hypothetical protein
MTTRGAGPIPTVARETQRRGWSEEFEPTAQAIRHWLTRMDHAEDLRSDGMTSAER